MRKIEEKFEIENQIEADIYLKDMEMFPYCYNWACDEKAEEGHIFCCGWCD